MKQLPLAIAPPPETGFDSLVVGTNAQAIAHLRALVAPAPPVYLWGPSGSGKTRLLRAAAGHRHSLGEHVGWFDAADALPWQLADNWGLVVVDDCHLLDAAHQAGAFKLFVEAHSAGMLWLCAGQVPPVDLALRDDLRSRLGWGHVFALQPLAEHETRSALRREADRRGIALSDDVMDYLLTRFERDMKHLMTLLDRLDEFALSERRHVTVALLRKMVMQSHSSP
jgi:DnaA-homolog protein